VKYTFPAAYGEDCVLVPIDAALVPMVAGALLHFQQRGYWKTESDYQQGYNAFAELQADMAGRCMERLIVEIRALRGGSFPAENWRDPDADPADIGLSTLGGVIIESANLSDKLILVNQKLDEIKAAIEASSADSDEILETLGQLAILLG
jgi:hypothetical protein